MYLLHGLLAQGLKQLSSSFVHTDSPWCYQDAKRDIAGCAYRYQ